MSPTRRFGSGWLAGVASGALILGLAIGWWVGQSSAPLITVRTADCPEPDATAPDPGEVDGRINDALETSLLTALQLAARVDSLESLMEDLDRQGVSARTAVGGLIQGLGEDDLRNGLGMLLRLDEEELDEIEDVRGFADRLANIAIEGTLEELDPETLSGAGEVIFSTEKEVEDPRAVAMSVFPADERRIWAMVSTEGLRSDSFLVKWARADKPEIDRLRRRSFDVSAPYAAFFLIRPTLDGWAPGEYRVTVYTGDEAMDLIATGSYHVREPGD